MEANMMHAQDNRSEEKQGTPSSAADSRISITVNTPADNQPFELPEVPLDTTPAEILDQLVTEGYLPQLPAGQRYQLCVSGGYDLHDNESLRTGGVVNGATLRVLTTTPGAATVICEPISETEPLQKASGSTVSACPLWLSQLETMHAARAGHFFLLHFNVSDYVFDGVRAPRRLVSFLACHLRERGYRRIALANLSSGFTWAAGNGPSAAAPVDVTAILRALSDALSERGGEPPAVIIENLEYLAPASGVGDREALRAAEILAGVAQDEALRASGCLIIALCRTVESVNAGVLEATGGVVPVQVPLPNAEDRLRLLEYLGSETPAVALAPLEDGFSLRVLANLTQGITLADLDALNREACAAGEAITYQRVRRCKKAAIEQQSKGLLEVIEARYGFDAIGGLTQVIAYFRSAVAHLHENRPEAAPKAVLLAGPPGTGKTLVAEALAKEAGFNLVRLGDIRSKWVGDSERNLTLVLRLLVELAPAVVFVDELDQAFGAHDRGSNADSGVSARLFARILNFMTHDEQRGRIIWVAATNRPDLLDEAMLRRFDRVFPFFCPSTADRRRIFNAMESITGVVYTNGIQFDCAVEATEGLTGSAIEVIVRRAIEIAAGASVTEDMLMQAVDDYKPNHDAHEYRLQSLLALNATNLYSALPPLEEVPREIAEIVRELRTRNSAAVLLNRLRQLQTSPGARREAIWNERD